MSMSETATVCPTCGAAVATTPATAAADAPALIATFNPASGWSGKAITHAAGRFTLDGYGEITPKDVLAYDAKGQLDWAYGGMRDWVAQMSTSPPSYATTAIDPRLASLVPGPGATQPAASPRVTMRWVGIVVALLFALSWVLSGFHGGTHYVSSLGTWLILAIALLTTLIARRR
jgi:hypothetical protein